MKMKYTSGIMVFWEINYILYSLKFEILQMAIGTITTPHTNVEVSKSMATITRRDSADGKEEI